MLLQKTCRATKEVFIVPGQQGKNKKNTHAPTYVGTTVSLVYGRNKKMKPNKTRKEEEADKHGIKETKSFCDLGIGKKCFVLATMLETLRECDVMVGDRSEGFMFCS